MFCKDKKWSFEHVLTGEKIPQEFYLMQPDKVDKPDKVKGQLFFSLFHFVIFIDFVIFIYFVILFLCICCFVVNSNMTGFQFSFVFYLSCLIFLEMMSLLK